MATNALKAKVKCAACAKRGESSFAIVKAGPVSGRPVCMKDYQRERRTEAGAPDAEQIDGELARIEVNIPVELLQRIDANAAHMGWSRSRLIRAVFSGEVKISLVKAVRP